MKRLRFTLAVLIPVLMLTLMFFTSCEKESDRDPVGGSGGNPLVDHFDVDINKSTSLEGYFGGSDTLRFTITAYDNSNLPVENVEFSFEITTGLTGSVIAQNNSKTDDSGVLIADYIAVFRQDDEVALKISSSTALHRTYPIDISVSDVSIQITAESNMLMVPMETSAATQLSIQVINEENIVVQGVPIKLAVLNNVGTLTTPTWDDVNNRFTTNLSIPFVVDSVSTLVRAYIDAPLPDAQTGDDISLGNDLPIKKKGYIVSTVVNTDTVSVTAKPNNMLITNISVQIDTSFIETSPGHGETTTVQIYATDQNSAGVPDIELYAKLISLDGLPVGTVSSLGPTNAEGLVVPTISTIGLSGLWALVIKTHEFSEVEYSDTLEIVFGNIQSIVMSADTSRLSVLGTGGENNTLVRAKVRDENGNVAVDGTMVHFLLTTFPYTVEDDTSDAYARPAINGIDTSEYPDLEHIGATKGLPYDSVETYHGEATITVTSGSETGFLSIDVWTHTAEGELISTTFQGLTIFSGPPEHIEIDYDPRGIQYAAGVWALELSARVQDALRNDVRDNIQVDFSGDHTYATFSNGLTGLMSPLSENMTPGVAYSFLTYQSEDTNRPLEIMASVLTGNGAVETDAYQILHLPIQTPLGQLFSNRVNWNYNTDGSTYALFIITCIVYDGYEHLINGERIRILPSHGLVYNEFGTHNPAAVAEEAITGPQDPYGEDDDDPEGTAVRYLCLSIPEAFPDGVAPQTTLTVNVDIIRGQDAVIEPLNLTLFNLIP
jgi:hypothetical protein